MKTQPNPPELNQLREWAYTVLVPSKESWAGCYASGALNPDADKKTAESLQLAVKYGRGVEGRVTGGIVEAWTSQQALERIHALHDYTIEEMVEENIGGMTIKRKTDKLLKVECVLRTLEPRTVLVAP